MLDAFCHNLGFNLQGQYIYLSKKHINKNSDIMSGVTVIVYCVCVCVSVDLRGEVRMVKKKC